MAHYTLEQLENLEDLCIGQADTLKIETADTRVWLSRCTIEDGEPYNNKVTLEKCVNGNWRTVDTYPAE